MIEERGRLGDEGISRFVAAGFGKDHVLEVVAATTGSGEPTNSTRRVKTYSSA